MRVLIADDQIGYLGEVFRIVNAHDSLTPEERVWPGEGQLVEEVLSNRSAQEFPLRLEGNIEILCAQSYDGALHLIEEHGDVDICLSDIEFSGQRADGPSILNACGVSPKNGILYTGQSKKQEIYEDSDIYIEDERDYSRAAPGRFRVVRFGLTEEFEDVIYHFLMESEHSLAEDRIQDTSISSGAKASWRNFEKELNSLFSGNRPDRADWQNCNTALTLEGGLEETRFGGVLFKHLFPFRDAFLNRRLIEVEEIIDGRAHESHRSWNHIKNKTQDRAEEISHLVLGNGDEGDEGDLRQNGKRVEGDSAQNKKVRVKEVHLNLEAPTNEALKVVTNVGEKTLSDIRDRGIFLLLAIKIRDSENIPVNGPVTTNYKRWSPPLVVSGLLMRHFRGDSGDYTHLKKPHDINVDNNAGKITSDDEMFIEYIKKVHKENNNGEVWKEVESIEGIEKGDRAYEYYRYCIKGPAGGGSQKYNITKSAPEGVPDSAAEFVKLDKSKADTSYEISEEVNSLEVKPEWIDSKNINFIEKLKKKILIDSRPADAGY